jgi:pimeloyl-ACP methyl ester carboxylesterase
MKRIIDSIHSVSSALWLTALAVVLTVCAPVAPDSEDLAEEAAPLAAEEEDLEAEEPSPATITTNHVYSGTNQMMVYQPAGYVGGTNTYPLVIFLSGAGKVTSSSTVADVLTESLPKLLSQGDRPPGLDGKGWLVAAPHAKLSGTWGSTLWLDAYNYMVANYRVDVDRVWIFGYSLGAAGAMIAAKTHPELLAGIVPVSGSQELAYPWATLAELAVWSHHGTADKTQAAQNTIRVGAGMNALSPPPRYAPLMSLYWNKGHGAAVNEDEVFRRKSSQLSGTKSKFDWDKWCGKFSRNPLKAAEGHVAYAEQSLAFLDYTAAKKLVDALPASADKTALLARLATLRAPLFTKAYVVDLGSSTYPSATPVNNITTINNGSSIANLVDTDSGASTIGFGITARFSTWQPQTEFSTRLNGAYWGLPASVHRDGARVLTTITNGQFVFSNLDDAKRYKLIALHSMDNGDDLATEAVFQLTVGGVTQKQYSQFNTSQFMEFDELAPVTGKITGTPVAASARDACLTTLILLEKP